MRRNDRDIKDIHLQEEIIKASDVCRIAIVNDNIPYIVSLNFGYVGGDHPCLYFHCANEGRKLEMLRKNNYVCFQMDTDHKLYEGKNGCDWGMSYSSVVGYGNVFTVTENEARIEGLDCIMKHYGGEQKFTYDEMVKARTTILRLDITELTAKKC